MKLCKSWALAIFAALFVCVNIHMLVLPTNHAYASHKTSDEGLQSLGEDPRLKWPTGEIGKNTPEWNYACAKYVALSDEEYYLGYFGQHARRSDLPAGDNLLGLDGQDYDFDDILNVDYLIKIRPYIAPPISDNEAMPDNRDDCYAQLQRSGKDESRMSQFSRELGRKTFLFSVCNMNSDCTNPNSWGSIDSIDRLQPIAFGVQSSFEGFPISWMENGHPGNPHDAAQDWYFWRQHYIDHEKDDPEHRSISQDGWLYQFAGSTYNMRTRSFGGRADLQGVQINAVSPAGFIYEIWDTTTINEQRKRFDIIRNVRIYANISIGRTENGNVVRGPFTNQLIYEGSFQHNYETGANEWVAGLSDVLILDTISQYVNVEIPAPPSTTGLAGPTATGPLGGSPVTPVNVGGNAPTQESNTLDLNFAIVSLGSLKNRPPDNQKCMLPASLIEYCTNPVGLLPLWRWGSVNYVWTDWGGNWFTSIFRSAGGSALDLIVRFSFLVASLAWRLLASLVNLALSADFSDALVASMDRVYYSVARPIMRTDVLMIVALIGSLVALWRIYKSGVQEGLRTILWTMLPLGFLVFMMLSIQRVYNIPDFEYEAWRDSIPEATSQQERAARLAIARSNEGFGTPSWIHEKTNNATAYLSNQLTDLSLGLSEGGFTHNSYCSVFRRQLEKLYLQARYDYLEGQNKLTSDNKLPQSSYSYIAISRLWERAYLSGWAQSQFGSPQRAYDGTCLWAEANSHSPVQTMAIWGTTCGLHDYFPNSYSGTGGWSFYGESTQTPLYGCAATSTSPNSPQPSLITEDTEYMLPSGKMIPAEPPVKKPKIFKSNASNGPYTISDFNNAVSVYNSQQAGRAWRIFKPFNSKETKTFLNLASFCGLTRGENLGETVDGDPRVPNKRPDSLRSDNFRVHSVHKDVISVRADNGGENANEKAVIMIRGYGLFLPSNVAGIARNKVGETGVFSDKWDWDDDHNWPYTTAVTCGIWLTGGEYAPQCPALPPNAATTEIALHRAYCPDGDHYNMHTREDASDYGTDDRVIGFGGGSDRTTPGNHAQHEGMISNFIQDEAGFDCSDAQNSASKFLQSNFTDPSSPDQIGDAGSLNQYVTNEDASRFVKDVCTTGGNAFGFRLLHSLVVLFTAIAFFLSLVGLAAGTALAQIILGIIFMMLPLLLLIIAIPSNKTRSLAGRLLKIVIGASLAHAIFLLLLTVMVLLIDIIVNTIAESTDPGWIRTMFLAFTPIVVLKLVSGLTKQFGFNATGFKGALALTSGLAAGKVGANTAPSAVERYGRNMAAYAGPMAMRRAMYGAMGPRVAGVGGRLAGRAAGVGGRAAGAGLLGGAAAGLGAGAAGGALSKMGPLKPSVSQSAGAVSGLAKGSKLMSQMKGKAAQMGAAAGTLAQSAAGTKTAPPSQAQRLSGTLEKGDYARKGESPPGKAPAPKGLLPKPQEEPRLPKSSVPAPSERDHLPGSVSEEEAATPTSVPISTSPRSAPPEPEQDMPDAGQQQQAAAADTSVSEEASQETQQEPPPPIEPIPGPLENRKLERTRIIAGHYAKRALRFAARHPVASLAAMSFLTMGIGAPAALLLYGTGKMGSLITRMPRRMIKRKMDEGMARHKESRAELREKLERAQSVAPATVTPTNVAGQQPPTEPGAVGAAGNAPDGSRPTQSPQPQLSQPSQTSQQQPPVEDEDTAPPPRNLGRDIRLTRPAPQEPQPPVDGQPPSQTAQQPPAGGRPYTTAQTAQQQPPSADQKPPQIQGRSLEPARSAQTPTQPHTFRTEETWDDTESDAPRQTYRNIRMAELGTIPEEEAEYVEYADYYDDEIDTYEQYRATYPETPNDEASGAYQPPPAPSQPQPAPQQPPQPSSPPSASTTQPASQQIPSYAPASIPQQPSEPTPNHLPSRPVPQQSSAPPRPAPEPNITQAAPAPAAPPPAPVPAPPPQTPQPQQPQKPPLPSQQPPPQSRRPVIPRPAPPNAPSFVGGPTLGARPVLPPRSFDLPPRAQNMPEIPTPAQQEERAAVPHRTRSAMQNVVLRRQPPPTTPRRGQS